MNRHSGLAFLLFPTLLGCVETTDQLPDLTPIGAAGQEQVCAAAYADRLGLPMSAIRVNGSDTSPVGNSVYFLQTADRTQSANCEITDNGIIVALTSTRG